MQYHFRQMIKALLVNLAGTLIYLLLASTTWHQVEIPLLSRTEDDVIRWVQWCLPALGIFAVANVIWLMAIVWRWRQSPILTNLGVWCAVIAIWAGTFKYSLYRIGYESHPNPPEELDDSK